MISSTKLSKVTLSRRTRTSTEESALKAAIDGRQDSGNCKKADTALSLCPSGKSRAQ
jgi:hypothetical protein